MNTPSIILSIIIALIYGALYHLIRDGGMWRLIFYLILSAVGFFAGTLFGNWLGWNILPVGASDLLTASIGSLLMLLIGDWLSINNNKPQSTV